MALHAATGWSTVHPIVRGQSWSHPIGQEFRYELELQAQRREIVARKMNLIGHVRSERQHADFLTQDLPIESSLGTRQLFSDY